MKRNENLSPQSIGVKKILTSEEAAAYMGISQSTLYKLTSSRQIPHFKPRGKMCYFDREELERWLQRNRVASMEDINDEARRRCS
ncbi:MAG: helix-turn-helix domain-containing protein [Bacteroides sp.]|nr:helix-turn-helix domain-containing protein [Ruminococcus flavefaciens]MCM1531067.1 helix-turn-helix domain-containing protein [Ruminococcus flavefaciens]MCM1554944.1 helix-turn-helix domain-containing protein [Bacteroides sp.]